MHISSALTATLTVFVTLALLTDGSSFSPSHNFVGQSHNHFRRHAQAHVNNEEGVHLIQRNEPLLPLLNKQSKDCDDGIPRENGDDAAVSPTPPFDPLFKSLDVPNLVNRVGAGSDIPNINKRDDDIATDQGEDESALLTLLADKDQAHSKDSKKPDDETDANGPKAASAQGKDSSSWWIPRYSRKAETAHDAGNTCHHFATLHHKSQAWMKACKKRNKKTARPVGTVSDSKQASPPSLPNEDLTKRSKMSAQANYKRGSNGYALVATHSGKTFFDKMFFFTSRDPSGGMIQYVDKTQAQHEGLIGLRNGHAFMKIGPGHNNEGIEHSVRVSTEESFTTGIFILDAYHMPTGCGVWPAFWTNPAEPRGGWPNGGEIDVIEGVHDFSRNMQSIHAPSSCHIPESVNMLGELAMPDKSLQRNCDPHETDDQGCGVQSKQDGDYGPAYNKGNGGIHAMVWDLSTGIQVYFFPRHKIPSDIKTNDPNPRTWGKPHGSWPAEHCNPAQYFKSHVAVFTNTVCGTWAGSSDVWNNPGPGQKESCAKKTGKSSCYEYMKSTPDLSKAYWEIESLKIYQKERQK